MTEATTSNYWFSPNAVSIQLNALGLPNYIQANSTGNAMVLVYMKDVAGLGYDDGHNYRRWKLVASPTVFNSESAKYVYIAIPIDDMSAPAFFVFPSERIDIYGKNEDEDQIAPSNYRYIFTQGIISEVIYPLTAGIPNYREWQQGISTGYLSSDEAIAGGPVDSEWYQYNALLGVVTLIKNVAMKAGNRFLNLLADVIHITSGGSLFFEDGGSVSKVATYESESSQENKTTEIVTPKYLHDRESFVEEKYIRKDQDDATVHKLTVGQVQVDGTTLMKGVATMEQQAVLKGGAQFGSTFTPGLFGQGACFDGDGYGEMRGLRLWEWLEVPELRFNRVTVNTGIQWLTFGGGIIDTVTPDTQGNATGSATLKLEDGEFGAIAVGDLCMGIWHDVQGNADETTDDRKGKFTFAGFKTVYFQITSVSGDNNDHFTYALRGQTDGGNGFHPFSQMHFAGRGNTINTERQAFVYSTTEYTIALKGVSTWVFGSDNYYEIRGLLDGFSMTALDRDNEEYTKEFEGYGQVFGNAYIFGQLDQFERVGYSMQIDQSLAGTMAPGETEVVTIKILNAYGDNVTSRFTNIAVTRNSGDSESDAVWNQTHLHVTNPFQLSFNDLGIDGIHRLLATFYVTATDEVADENVNGTIDFFS